MLNQLNPDNSQQQALEIPQLGINSLSTSAEAQTPPVPIMDQYHTPVHSIISKLPEINHQQLTGGDLNSNYGNILRNVFGSSSPQQIIDILNEINPSDEMNYGAQVYSNSMHATHGDLYQNGDNYKEINSQLKNIIGKTDGTVLASNGDDGADPNNIQKSLSDIYATLRGGANMATGTDISQKVNNFIQPIVDSDKLKYVFGGKSLDGKGIDCSGWVAKTTLNAMKDLGEYDMKKMSKLMNTSAAEQISTIGKIAGFLPTSAIQSGQLPDGSLIGITQGSFAKNRPLGIGHIVQFFRDDDGNPMITMSSKNNHKDGPQTLSYPEFLAMYQNKPMYAVNPFSLQNTTRINKA